MSIAEDKQEIAAAAITAMISEFKIGRHDLLRSKFAEHVKFRSIAIKRLHELGLGYGAIALAMDMNASSIRYWLRENYRTNALAARLKYKRRAMEARA